MKKALPKLELITASVTFGTIGVIRKAIPLNSGMLSMLRGFIGAAVLLLILSVQKKQLNLNAIKKNMGKLCISGAAIGINWILCFESYRYTSIAVSTLCYYMAPIFVIVASALVLKESLSKTNIICTIVAVIGMILISQVRNDGHYPHQIIGILLALAAAILYATDIICNKLMHDIGAMERTIFQLAASAVVVIPYVAFAEEPTTIETTWKTVMLVALLGVMHTGIAYALFFDSLPKLKTQTVAFFTYIDPILAVILSALVLHEPITLWVIVGAVCILGSALYNELKTN